MRKLKRPIFLDKLNTKSKKRRIIALAVIIVVALAGYAAYSFTDKSGGKLFAEAAGHNIYEQDVRNLLGDNNPEVSDYDAAKVLADKYLIEYLAEEQGVVLTDQELEYEYGPQIKEDKTGNKYVYQYKVNQLYFNKLSANNRGIYKGKLLVTHFSRHLAYESPLLKERKRENPKIGDPKAIARDKKYAEDLINRLYNDVKSGKITFDEAIQVEHDDPVVGTKAYQTLSHSGLFDTTFRTNGTNGLLLTASIDDHIRGLRAGDITEPFVVRVSNSSESDKTAESYFLVVQMDEVSGGNNSDLDFRQYLEEVKERLKYEIYV